MPAPPATKEPRVHRVRFVSSPETYGARLEIDGKTATLAREFRYHSRVGDVDQCEISFFVTGSEIDTHGVIRPIAELIGEDEEAVARDIYERLKARFEPAPVDQDLRPYPSP